VGNDMVEEKMCCCVNGVVKCGNMFVPLGKVIYYQDNVLVSIT
jgi:hypothetical protein